MLLSEVEQIAIINFVFFPVKVVSYWLKREDFAFKGYSVDYYCGNDASFELETSTF